MTNIALWLLGAALIGLALLRVRAPFARMSELDRLAENARKYESWRGGRNSPAAGHEVTGADIMRQLLRRQVYRWAGVGIVGVVLVVAGFAIR